MFAFASFVKGHFCSVLLSNIIGYLRFCRLNISLTESGFRCDKSFFVCRYMSGSLLSIWVCIGMDCDFAGTFWFLWECSDLAHLWAFWHFLLLCAFFFRYAFRFRSLFCLLFFLLSDAQFIEGLCHLTHVPFDDSLLHVIDNFLFSLVHHRVNGLSSHYLHWSLVRIFWAF